LKDNLLKNKEEFLELKFTNSKLEEQNKTLSDNIKTLNEMNTCLIEENTTLKTNTENLVKLKDLYSNNIKEVTNNCDKLDMSLTKYEHTGEEQISYLTNLVTLTKISLGEVTTK